MDDRGRIQSFATSEEARLAGFNIPLAKGEVERLLASPEADRIGQIVAERHNKRAAATAAAVSLASLAAVGAMGSGPRPAVGTFCPSVKSRKCFKKRRRR